MPSVKYFSEVETQDISVITEMELLGKFQINSYEKKIISEMLENCYILDIDVFIKQKTIELKQHYKLKLPDAIIAATAIQKGLLLVTADKKLQKIPGLDLIQINI